MAEPVTIAALLAIGWGLARLGKLGPSIGPEPPRPGPAPGKRAATPGQAAWPRQDLLTRASEQQKAHDALQAHLDSQAQDAVDKAKAKHDQAALADIAAKKRAQQKALDDMQADIDLARAEAMAREVNAPPKA